MDTNQHQNLNEAVRQVVNELSPSGVQPGLNETSLAKQAQVMGAREMRNKILKKVAKEVPPKAKAQRDKNEKRVIKRLRKLGADKVKRATDSGELEMQSPHIWDFAKAHGRAGAEGELKKQGYSYEFDD